MSGEQSSGIDASKRAVLKAVGGLSTASVVAGTATAGGDDGVTTERRCIKKERETYCNSTSIHCDTCLGAEFERECCYHADGSKHCTVIGWTGDCCGCKGDI